MAEIADEELSDIIPRIKQPISNNFQDIGYYKDENGYTRFGIIPKTNQFQTKAKWDLYDGRSVTSNPLYR